MLKVNLLTWKKLLSLSAIGFLTVVFSAKLHAFDWQEWQEEIRGYQSGQKAESKPRQENNSIKSSSTSTSTSTSTNNPQFVNRLDQEILLLRAEMSKRNGDVIQVKRYLEQLQNQTILPPFKARVASLKQYVAANSGFFNRSQYVQQLQFPMYDANAVVALVLPTSGEYEEVGLSLQTSLQNALNKAGFKGRLIAVDSNLYGSAFEIWEVLKYYQPNFVFGPLTKELVTQWQALRTGVQTLFFNNVDYLGVGEFSLSPNRLAGLEQVFQVLEQGQYENVLVLTDESEKSQELEQAFKQAWLQYKPYANYQSESIKGNVSDGLANLLSIKKSQQRHRWLQRVLGQNLAYDSRVRQDVEVVVSFLAQEQAIQVAPYIDYVSTNQKIIHVWYPSQTPTSAYLAFNNQAWQQSFLLLPQSVSLQENLENSRKNSVSNTQNKTGLFHALGQVAVQIVKSSTTSTALEHVEFTEYGGYVRNASGQFNLLPIVYWADNGIIEKYFQLAD